MQTHSHILQEKQQPCTSGKTTSICKSHVIPHFVQGWPDSRPTRFLLWFKGTLKLALEVEFVGNVNTNIHFSVTAQISRV